jgi:HrpA-like RNA helicase
MSQAQFWRPEKLCDRSNDAKEDLIVTNNKYKNLSIQRQRELLPITRYRDHILAALEKFTTLVIVSETGTGNYFIIDIYF